MHCQNCGQINTQASNFCRFCGTKFMAAQLNAVHNFNGNISKVSNFEYVPKVNNFEIAPPRPYSWKTDEFQIAETKTPKAKQISQVQPFADFRTKPDLNFQQFPPQQIQTQQQQSQAITNGYHCPRCRSQLFPRSVKQISNGGWIVFAVLLVTFFPLFWVGLLIKDEMRVCPVCNYRYS